MKNKKNFRWLTAVLASMLALLMATPLTAFAYAGGDAETAQTEQAETEAADTQQSDSTQTTRIGTVTTNGGNLNLRSGASTSYGIIGQLPNGDTVTVISEENGWYKVIVPEKEGFVYGGYLKVSNVIVTPPEDTEPETNLAPLTPNGNLDLVDDIIQTSDGKEFITVQSKNDNTFYIVIDRDKDNENVYFLNLVDEADLMALMEDGEVTLKCTCDDRCEAGDVDTSCPVCRNNMSECTGTVKEEPAETTEESTEPEPEEPEQKSGNSSMLLVVILIAALGIGGAVYFLKFKKQKPDTKGSTDLDDYDFGEDDDEDDMEYVSEDETEQEDES